MNKYMKIIDEIKTFFMGFFVAISMYSKIPVPQLPWSDKNMKYAICFFPFVGAFTGILFCVWYYICSLFQIPELTRTLIAVMIPVAVTGGIHVDGFMDTSDAIHSYQSKERKLEILKDSHVGAFSVIMLFFLIVTETGWLFMVQDRYQVLMISIGFVMSRTLSGMSVVTFANAKKEGTLYAFSSTAQKRIVRGVLFLEFIICAIALMLCNLLCGILMTVASIVWFCGYYAKSKKEFGGITGDLAGWFLCIDEWIIYLVAGLMA